ncbi:hypothetical protein KCP73_16375 [Salmonella enterica subsp. enterica]|nr:hypothetical protein KCP73_16375 [Salmonella enterica subsp. enterica]
MTSGWSSGGEKTCWRSSPSGWRSAATRYAVVRTIVWRKCLSACIPEGLLVVSQHRRSD